MNVVLWSHIVLEKGIALSKWNERKTELSRLNATLIVVTSYINSFILVINIYNILLPNIHDHFYTQNHDIIWNKGWNKIRNFFKINHFDCKSFLHFLNDKSIFRGLFKLCISISKDKLHQHNVYNDQLLHMLLDRINLVIDWINLLTMLLNY